MRPSPLIRARSLASRQVDQSALKELEVSLGQRKPVRNGEASRELVGARTRRRRRGSELQRGLRNITKERGGYFRTTPSALRVGLEAVAG